ncbi:hypothetical protein [Klebsiella pneumoniae ISC21]|nr:hypothetical protein [Klebsiella pneumoniae ISC21]
MLIFQASQADNSQRFREVKKGDIFNVVYQNAPFILMTWIFLWLARKRKEYFQKTFLYGLTETWR